jgi:hypothetical protein
MVDRIRATTTANICASSKKPTKPNRESKHLKIKPTEHKINRQDLKGCKKNKPRNQKAAQKRIIRFSKHTSGQKAQAEAIKHFRQ